METTTPPSAWRWLSGGAHDVERGENDGYYARLRPELLELIDTPPTRVLDIGCGGGATDAELKRRYPAAFVTGIETVAVAVKHAQGRLDRVIHANAETLDLQNAGFANGSLDLIIAADVLEHMYDPWHMLDRLRPLLAPGGRIIASIPNVRNLWLLDKIARGNFDYQDEGLLDITHLRFFTYNEMRAMFAHTGYAIERTRFNRDGHLPERVPLERLPARGSFQHLLHAVRTALNPRHAHVLVSREHGQSFRIDTARLTLRGLCAQDIDELFAITVHIVAYVA